MYFIECHTLYLKMMQMMHFKVLSVTRFTHNDVYFIECHTLYLTMMQMMNLVVLSVVPGVAAVAASASVVVFISRRRFEHDAAAFAVVLRVMRMRMMKLLLLHAVDEDGSHRRSLQLAEMPHVRVRLAG